MKRARPDSWYWTQMALLHADTGSVDLHKSSFGDECSATAASAPPSPPLFPAYWQPPDAHQNTLDDPLHWSSTPPTYHSRTSSRAGLWENGVSSTVQPAQRRSADVASEIISPSYERPGLASPISHRQLRATADEDRSRRLSRTVSIYRDSSPDDWIPRVLKHIKAQPS